MKREEVRYKNTTDGAWLDDREDYFKALTESQYVRQRSRLIETLFLWWSDVLRANTGVARPGAAVCQRSDPPPAAKNYRRRKSFAVSGVSKKCATTSAATFRKRSRLRSRF